MRKYIGGGDLLPVKEPKVGMKYHVAWAFSNGVVGVCTSIDTEKKTVKLRSPKTKMEFKCDVKWEDLRHTRMNQVINPH